MTVNIDSLIKYLGKSHKEMYKTGIIPYNTKPKGHSGSSTVSLNMAKEGIFLSFLREDKTLKEITLYIQRDEIVSTPVLVPHTF